MHTPDKIQISTSTRLQKFQRLIQVNVWIKAVMSSGNWNRNPSICASSGSSLLQQPRGSESTITSICGSIKLLMRNNCARFETCMIFFFKVKPFLLDVQEEPTNEWQHLHDPPGLLFCNQGCRWIEGRILDENNDKYTYCSLNFSFVFSELSPNLLRSNCILYRIYLFPSMCSLWYSKMKSSEAVCPDRAKAEKGTKEWSEGLWRQGSSPPRSKPTVIAARWPTGVSQRRFYTGTKEKKKRDTKDKTKIEEKPNTNETEDKVRRGRARKAVQRADNEEINWKEKEGRKA